MINKDELDEKISQTIKECGVAFNKHFNNLTGPDATFAIVAVCSALISVSVEAILEKNTPTDVKIELIKLISEEIKYTIKKNIIVKMLVH